MREAPLGEEPDEGPEQANSLKDLNHCKVIGTTITRQMNGMQHAELIERASRSNATFGSLLGSARVEKESIRFGVCQYVTLLDL